MFNDVLDYTKQLQSSAETTQAFLYRLRGGRTRLINKIIKAEESTKLMSDETKYVASLKPQIKLDALQATKDTLFAKAVQAIRENYEFNAEPYQKALFLAIEDNDTYRIDIRGSGFESTISVDINLDKTAGRLNMWGSAVKAARRELGIKTPNKNNKNYQKLADQASRAWAGIFSARGEKFLKTVQTRLKLSARPAPFWQILDKGTVPLSSDRGGYPTPTNTNTNFVFESEHSVNEYFKNYIFKLKIDYQKLFSQYERFLEEAQTRLLELNEMIDEISLDVKKTNQLRKRLEEIYKGDIDSNKLEKAVQLVREGLLTKGKVELTAKGSKSRVRPSISVIKEYL